MTIVKHEKTVNFIPNKISILETLENKNYLLLYNEMKDEYFLEEQEDFTLPEKLYGNLGGQVDRYLHAFKNRERNLGILLKGLKGTGKSLVAKKLCIESQLPTILITKAYSGTTFERFLASIKQECIIFIDEFEKIYTDSGLGSNRGGSQDTLLSILDGVFEGKKIFLLTANESRSINDAFINRPGRIHYLKEYGGLSQEVIEEVIDDNLDNKKYRAELLEVTQIIGEINMDSLITLINEINMFKETPRAAVSELNIRPARCIYKMEWKKTISRYVGEKTESGYEEEEVTFSDRVDSHPLTLQNVNRYGEGTDSLNSNHSDRIKYSLSESKVVTNEDSIIITIKGGKEITFTKLPKFRYTF